jgi:hypothetical protein
MGRAQQPAALTQQTFTVVMVAPFTLQIDEICGVTFLHYNFSGVL